MEAEAEPSAELANDLRVVSMLPAELLQPGEIIILLLKPSPAFIVLSCLGHLAFLLLGLFAGLWLEAQGLMPALSRRDVALLFITLISARLAWQVMDWLGRVYVMTDRRIISVQGVLQIQVFEAPLQNITHTHTLFSLRERLMALGTLAFSTAGMSYPQAFWVMLADPLRVHQIVVQALNRYR